MNAIQFFCIIIKKEGPLKRTKLSDRELPTYTKGEEIFNMVSHIVGAGLSIVALILCIVFSAIHHNTYGIVSSCIYGVSSILLYTMSSIYHGLSPKLHGKKVLQILDHCTIFILIAGCYTPFTLCTIREESPAWGWSIFGVIWAAAILGVVLNSIDLKKYRKFSLISYILMGWGAVIRFPLLVQKLGIIGILLLIGGGIAYTIGVVFYVVGKKKKYMHSIFHLLILLGSILHFFCIFFFVI